MKKSIALAVLAGATVWGAEPVSLDLKTGQWEYTVTMQMAGMPAQARQMPSIPPETLAKMPPEQRAKVEAAMAQAGNVFGGKPIVSNSCVKKEDLQNFNPSRAQQQNCKTTVLNSSSGHFEARIDCNTSANKTTSTIFADAVNPESMKFKMNSTGVSHGQPINMTITGTGKWLSPMCSEK